MTPELTMALVLGATCWLSGGTRACPPPRVQCRASRYPVAIDCFWNLPPDTTRPTSFIATYRLGVAAGGASRPCEQPSHCEQSCRCRIPDVQLFSMVPYVLNVTAVYPGGATSSFLPFLPEHIIKPDPPEGVHLSPLSGQWLRVQWDPPRTWPYPDVFALKYRIRYRWRGAGRFREIGPIEATSFTLRAGRPGAASFVQVSAQDLTNYGAPSDWSPPTRHLWGSQQVAQT